MKSAPILAAVLMAVLLMLYQSLFFSTPQVPQDAKAPSQSPKQGQSAVPPPPAPAAVARGVATPAPETEAISRAHLEDRMVAELKAASIKVVKSQSCPPTVKGRYRSSDRSITLCTNNYVRSEALMVLAHETVHAVQDCVGGLIGEGDPKADRAIAFIQKMEQDLAEVEELYAPADHTLNSKRGNGRMRSRRNGRKGSRRNRWRSCNV